MLKFRGDVACKGSNCHWSAGWEQEAIFSAEALHILVMASLADALAMSLKPPVTSKPLWLRYAALSMSSASCCQPAYLSFEGRAWKTSFGSSLVASVMWPFCINAVIFSKCPAKSPASQPSPPAAAIVDAAAF